MMVKYKHMVHLEYFVYIIIEAGHDFSSSEFNADDDFPAATRQESCRAARPVLE